MVNLGIIGNLLSNKSNSNSNSNNNNSGGSNSNNNSIHKRLLRVGSQRQRHNLNNMNNDSTGSNNSSIHSTTTVTGATPALSNAPSNASSSSFSSRPETYPQLTAETVAALPPPGQSGPSALTFSPDGRYLAFLSSTHGGGANDGERRLCAVDVSPYRRASRRRPPAPKVTRLLQTRGGGDGEGGDASAASSRVAPLVGAQRLSLEERLRRERQRSHATGVTQFSWCSVRRRTRGVVVGGGATGRRGDEERRDPVEGADASTPPYRILVPLAGNVYVQDGVGAPLRSVYDRQASLRPRRRRHANDVGVEVVDDADAVAAARGDIVGRDRSAVDPQLSPDGSTVAFVVAGDLYRCSAEAHAENHNTPVRLTVSPSPSITHGLADFVAQEEMDRYRGFWWCGNDRLVVARVDETDVPRHRIAHQGRDAASDDAYEDHRYPFAGRNNPKVRLGWLDAFSETPTVEWTDAPADASEYLARVHALPDGSVCAQWENRAQTLLVLARTERPDDGPPVSHALLRERSDVWINLHHMFRVLPRPVPIDDDLSPPTLLPDGSFSFLFASERTGWRHLYLYTYVGGSRAEARLVRAVTSGEWVVESIVGVDVRRNLVYVTGTRDSELERHLYVVPLTNDGCDDDAPRRLTVDPGMHNVVMDPGCRIVVDSSSDLRRPTSVRVYRVEHREDRHGGEEIEIDDDVGSGTWYSSSLPRPALRPVFVLHDAATQDGKLAESGLFAPPEIITYKTSDGTADLHAALYLPDAKVHGPGPYPLVASVYGGPHVQRVNRSWSQSADMRAQRLRSLGLAVVKCDNRGSDRRGAAFETCIHRRLGRLEVLDQVSTVRHLVARGVADPDRVGVYGWSYGGYLAAMCLCRAPDVFRAAVAGAPVTSWDGYDTHYTERYMGTPTDNPEGYRESAVFEHVGNMTGRLMIVHGLIDENVHFRHTARLINRLVAAGKDYDLLLFPDERHSPRRLRDRVYMEQRICNYFLKELLLPPPAGGDDQRDRPSPRTNRRTTDDGRSGGGGAESGGGCHNTVMRPHL